MKIQEVIDVVLAAVPGVSIARTVDTFKSGDPAGSVTGIVTTFMATWQVVRRASQLGANLIITHEPTYYSHRDEAAPLAGDPVFEAKRRLIEESGITIWRFHDFWHRHSPDGIATGLARKLGWEAYRDPDRPTFFRIPPTVLRELAATIGRKLGIAGLRVAGDLEMNCRGIATALGAAPWQGHREALLADDVDVLICGETREWETCEYVRDGLAAGRRKALVVLGHCNSEEPGMEYLAEWLRPRLPGVPVTFVAAGDPFAHF